MLQGSGRQRKYIQVLSDWQFLYAYPPTPQHQRTNTPARMHMSKYTRASTQIHTLTHVLQTMLFVQDQSFFIIQSPFFHYQGRTQIWGSDRPKPVYDKTRHKLS